MIFLQSKIILGKYNTVFSIQLFLCKLREIDKKQERAAKKA